MSHPQVDAGDALPLTLPRLLSARAQDPRDFVIVDEERLSYHEANARSATLARGLLAAGAGPGQHIGLLYPNGADFVVAGLAIMRIGAVAVPISTFSRPREIAELVRNAGLDRLLAANRHRRNDFVHGLQEAFPELDLEHAGGLWSTGVPSLRYIHFATMPSEAHRAWAQGALLDAADSVPESLLNAIEQTVRPADPMVVIHTSGSTSAPKGVLHTHGGLLRHVDNLNQSRRFTRDEILFSNSPWFWIGGFAYTLLGTLLAGARLVCSNAEEPAKVLDLLERERPTMVNGFAQSVAHLARHPSFPERDLSSIRRGNLYPIMPEALRPADPALRHGMLGMTEGGSVVLDAPHEGELPESQRGSFGRPAVGFEARVIEAGDDHRPATTGEIGELQLRGPFLMEGYLGRERHEAFDPDQWFCTGDLFHVDANGLYYFHGRAGSMIKTAGANVSPLEVEAEIAELTGCAAHVLGLPDPERGQRVAAAIVTADEIDLDALAQALRERLSAYKMPRTFLRLRPDEVPLMSSGKLDPKALEKCFDGH